MDLACASLFDVAPVVVGSASFNIQHTFYGLLTKLNCFLFYLMKFFRYVDLTIF